MTDRKIVPGLVSLITPCYETERFVPRFLDSILSQSYKELELILVNDGSTDRTQAIIDNYLPALEAEGYKTIVINQENAGLAGAVDSGLKVFSGEFLTWPDPDDWLTPNSIERRVCLLKEHPEVAVLRSNATQIDEETQQFSGTFLPENQEPRIAENLFEDLLFTRTFFAPICHMVRSSAFLEVNPERAIYFAPSSSQNLQMLLPIMEQFDALETGESLGFYCVRSDSRSRRSKSSGEIVQRFQMLLDATENTLVKLKSFRESSLNTVRQSYYRNKILPFALRGGLFDTGVEALSRTQLRPSAKLAAKFLFHIRCSKVFTQIDNMAGRVFSRSLYRIFARAIKMPDSDCIWNTLPA